jgi:hypothetical protein
MKKKKNKKKLKKIKEHEEQVREEENDKDLLGLYNPRNKWSVGQN